MTGFVHITGAQLPEDLTGEDGSKTYGFTIEADAVLDLPAEPVAMVYNLGVSLGFGEAEWNAVRLMAEHRADGISELHYQIGGFVSAGEDIDD